MSTYKVTLHYQKIFRFKTTSDFKLLTNNAKSIAKCKHKQDVLCIYRIQGNASLTLRIHTTYSFGIRYFLPLWTLDTEQMVILNVLDFLHVFPLSVLEYSVFLL